MGRYINGEIEGKCWFGVQPSDFADRFGQVGVQNHIEYTYTDEDLPSVEEELKHIRENLGNYYDMFVKFFQENETYTDKELRNYLKVDEDKKQYLLREYADYKFGVRLRDYLKENAYCSFEVECW